MENRTAGPTTHPCHRLGFVGRRGSSTKHYTFLYLTWRLCCEVPNAVSWTARRRGSECFELQDEDERLVPEDPDEPGFCGRKKVWSELKRIMQWPRTLERDSMKPKATKGMKAKGMKGMTAKGMKGMTAKGMKGMTAKGMKAKANPVGTRRTGRTRVRKATTTSRIPGEAII